jgi:hypothetical protein
VRGLDQFASTFKQHAAFSTRRGLCEVGLSRMIMRALIAAAFFMFLGVADGSSAQFGLLTGNDIHSACQHDRSFALGYTAGLWDGAVHSAFVAYGLMIVPKPRTEAATNFAHKGINGFCVPREVTLDQVTDVFCAYLRTVPGERHGFPPILFNTALQKTWPCK